MGEVRLARDTLRGRGVAIKVLPGELAEDADRLARFGREARSMAALAHQGILAVLDFGLARQAASRGGGAETRSPALTRQTEPGAVLGTSGCMWRGRVQGAMPTTGPTSSRSAASPSRCGRGAGPSGVRPRPRR